MGTFRVDATFANPHDPDRRQMVSVLVDTGATWTTLPEEIIQELGCSVLSRRRVRLADGREQAWPIVSVLTSLEGQQLPTVCLVGPAGGPALLGAVTLEEFGLGVDPIARRLVPVTGYLMEVAPVVLTLSHGMPVDALGRPELAQPRHST